MLSGTQLTMQHNQCSQFCQNNAARVSTGGWGQGLCLPKRANPAGVMNSGILIEDNLVFEGYGEGIGCVSCENVIIQRNSVRDSYSVCNKKVL